MADYLAKGIELELEGPFKLVGGDDKNLFTNPESQKTGVYFFTIKVGGSYRIQYVGITTRSYRTRFREHMEKQLGGAYTVLDYNLFVKGKNKPLWFGDYGKNKEKDYSKFLDNYPSWSSLSYKQIKAYNIFLLPLNDARLMERIEGAIYENLKSSEDQRVADMLDKEIRYKLRKETETPLWLEIKTKTSLLGLPSRFKV